MKEGNVEIAQDYLSNEKKQFNKDIYKNEKKDEFNKLSFNMDFTSKKPDFQGQNYNEINISLNKENNNFLPKNSLRKTQYASINDENNPSIDLSKSNLNNSEIKEIISPNLINQDILAENNNIIFSDSNKFNQGQYNLKKISEIKTVSSQEVQNILNYQPKDILSLLQQTQSSIKLTKQDILNSLSDQQTTIILQKIVMEASYDVIISIVNELKGVYRDIIKDKNGNYFCSDLFKVCELNERLVILAELSPYLSEDCVNNYATHPIQTLIQYSSSEKEYELILYSFNDYNKLLFATLSPNGAYAIQKIIERIPEKYRTNFNLIFISFITFVSKKKFGIVTVKKFISCTKSEEITAKILTAIKNNFMNLAMDVYANYLIQYLLEKWNNIPEGQDIKELVTSNFKILSESKYSSFICEMYIKIANRDEKKDLINSLDSNEINTNNPYSMKIMKALGLFNTMENKSYNKSNLPLNLNDSNISNDSYNFIHNFNNLFSSQNNTNNNMNQIFGEDNLNQPHKNSNKKKYKKNNNFDK